MVCLGPDRRAADWLGPLGDSRLRGGWPGLSLSPRPGDPGGLGTLVAVLRDGKWPDCSNLPEQRLECGLLPAPGPPTSLLGPGSPSEIGGSRLVGRGCHRYSVLGGTPECSRDGVSADISRLPRMWKQLD